MLRPLPRFLTKSPGRPIEVTYEVPEEVLPDHVQGAGKGSWRALSTCRRGSQGRGKATDRNAESLAPGVPHRSLICAVRQEHRFFR